MANEMTTAAQAEAMRKAILAPPAALRMDLQPTWLRYGPEGVPFDKAAEDLLGVHARDGGTITDQPVLDLRRWKPVVEGVTLALAEVAPTGQTARVYRLRQTAYQGLCERLDLNGGGKLIRDRLPPVAQVQMLAILLQRWPDNLPAVFRVRGDDIVAITSDKYAAVDDVDFLMMMREVLTEQGLFAEARVTDLAHGMIDNLRVVIPSAKPVEPRVGDISRRALDMRNSMFGRSSLYLSPSMFRLRCTNGMTEEVPGIRSRFAHRGKQATVKEGVREAFKAILHHGSEQERRYVAATTHLIDQVGLALDALYGDYELTKGEVEVVQAQILADQEIAALPARGLSLYDLANGITRAAHEAGAERRLELESTAGRLIQDVLGGSAPKAFAVAPPTV